MGEKVKIIEGYSVSNTTAVGRTASFLKKTKEDGERVTKSKESPSVWITGERADLQTVGEQWNSKRDLWTAIGKEIRNRNGPL